MARVLVVDDDPIVRSIVVQFLQFGGHTAFEAASGVEALDKLSDSQPDLVITDLSMPGMSGLELRTIGRDVAPEIPFVLMSGYIVDAHVRAEFDAVLEKPLDFKGVLNTVNKMIPPDDVVATSSADPPSQPALL